MAACEKLAEVDTVLTADSVEWCPCGDLHQVLASGTYQLDEKAGLRRGALAMYEWNHSTCRYGNNLGLLRMLDIDAQYFFAFSLTRILEMESSVVSDGILDMKWYERQRDTST